ncbi:MAG: thioredoxin family protein [Candidatus Marinimicrobia bacterium]|jgi:thioredoxin-like negative regulator of GroEL|nr:thioredoxin family protein [Candidatus Neomarinimicrobiota bacterium]MBT3633850.1 thioredoxin family protein [Candidatus Neomarinimicrobiota bacterium]MBT3682642.1 thioredoxin family protein [Candidatus Neomarinimicrobiota bacterium]MBT3759406.1 thioredoxin family protein [Candidatus Neomarinimicrobiota bacterium]MBT3894586.1 thioredoxin family protein [Candidatus Neomarinimicrobiota bacterium]
MEFQEFHQELKSNQTIAVYFTTVDCQVCRVVKPKLKSILKEYPHISLMEINSMDSPIIASQNMVFAVPTLIIFSDGNEVKRFSRYLDMPDISSFLHRISHEDNIE